VNGTLDSSKLPKRPAGNTPALAQAQAPATGPKKVAAKRPRSSKEAAPAPAQAQHQAGEEDEAADEYALPTKRFRLGKKKGGKGRSKLI
jgi:hypothetical protein